MSATAAAMLLGCPAPPKSGRPLPELRLAPGDRLLVLAPHPDDEVLGAAGVIQAARCRGIPVFVAFLTSGESNTWASVVAGESPFAPQRALRMGRIRQTEALRADALLGVSASHVALLGYPDGGALTLWREHWGRAAPYRSPRSGAASVPYLDAYQPGAPYRGEAVVAALVSIVRAVRPTVVLVSHPADAHPDHRALYLFTRVALWDLQRELSPRILPYLVHRPHWPQPARYAPALGLAPPPELADEADWVSHRLADEARATKLAALQEHRSQYRSDGFFLRRLVRAEELFGDLPPARLPRGATAELTTLSEQAPAAEVPEELARAEQGLWIEVGDVSIRRDADALWLTVSSSRGPGRGGHVTIDVFGYRDDHPFATMPKVRLELGREGLEALDRNRRMPVGAVTLQLTPGAAVLRLPLRSLGDPQRLLLGIHSHAGRLPLASFPWRIVELP